MSLRAELEVFLGEPGGRRVVLVGIGSSIRHDDVVGLKVLELVEGKFPPSVLLLLTETVPESYTGAIRDFAPTHVLLLDAAHFNGAPGEGRIIPTKMIANVSNTARPGPPGAASRSRRRSRCDRSTTKGSRGVPRSIA